jgi:hypothetical protein
LTELSNMMERITAGSARGARRAARFFSRVRMLGSHRKSEPAW